MTVLLGWICGERDFLKHQFYVSVGREWQENTNTSWHKDKRCVEHGADSNLSFEKRQCREVHQEERKHKAFRKWWGDISRIFLS